MYYITEGNRSIASKFCSAKPSFALPLRGNRLPYIAEGDVRRGNALPYIAEGDVRRGNRLPPSYIAFGDVWAMQRFLFNIFVCDNLVSTQLFLELFRLFNC